MRPLYFLYLTAIIDWHSRCIVGWEVDDTLDTRMVINALKKAFKVAKPQILNSDQGCQFTSQQYIDFVKENGIRQSMDGKSVNGIIKIPTFGGENSPLCYACFKPFVILKA